MSDGYDRAVVRGGPQKGRMSRAWDTLQATLRQSAETVTRSATIQATSGDVEDIDPPSDIDELHQLYEEIGLIRANLNQFVSDVFKPGVRVVAEDDATEAYFMGGDDAPESAPDGGFLSEAFVTDERRQPFLHGVRMSETNRWSRGTIVHERLKADPEDAESQITGYQHIRPETLSARTYENTSILLEPDPDAPANDGISVSAQDTTKRGELAAFVQFDEQSILGRRDGDRFNDTDSIPLSQNDILKQTLDQNIGGDDEEDGIFGTSIIRAIKDDAEEYRSIKRDRAEAIKSKAYGLWTAQFKPEVIETEEESILIEWDDADISDTESSIEDMGPGGIVTTDALLDLERHDSEVPRLESTLDHYVDSITAPLPAPKYSVGFEKDINQFVTERQDQRYQQTIEDARRLHERDWTNEFREVARRHPDLDPEGLRMQIQPTEEESPALSLDTETVERIETLAGAMADLYGPGGAPSFISERVINELVLQLPEDASMDDVEGDALEDLQQQMDDDQVRAEFDRLVGQEAD